MNEVDKYAKNLGVDPNSITNAKMISDIIKEGKAVEQEQHKHELELIDKQNAPIISELKKQNNILQEQYASLKGEFNKTEERTQKAEKESKRSFIVSIISIAIAAVSLSIGIISIIIK